jgi:hypothetical protein
LRTAAGTALSSAACDNKTRVRVTQISESDV